MTDEAKLYRCMGGNRCNHVPGTCTATNTEYQAKAKEKQSMTDEAKALVGKLRERAAEVRGYIASCQIVVDLLAPEMQKFNAREAPWDVYTVRMAVDHESSIRTQAKEAEEYEASADLIETQAREIERLREALNQVLLHRYGDWTDIARAALAGDSHDQ